MPYRMTVLSNKSWGSCPGWVALGMGMNQLVMSNCIVHLLFFCLFVCFSCLIKLSLSQPKKFSHFYPFQLFPLSLQVVNKLLCCTYLSARLNHNTFLWIPFLLHPIGKLLFVQKILKIFFDLCILAICQNHFNAHIYWETNIQQLRKSQYQLWNLIFKGPKILLYF